MRPQKPLLFVVVTLQIHAIFAQLGNSSFSAEEILDYHDPTFTRIVGGKPINIRRVPWQVALYRNSYFICGGSIISKDWVLTAAHCITAGGRFAIGAGSSWYKKMSTFRRPAIIVVNAWYNPYTDNRDIALIRVKTPFTWNRRIRPIKLARQGRKLPSRYFLSGWGDINEYGTSSRQLRGVTVRRIGHQTCRTKYRNGGVQITKNMICAASPGKDSCSGDSGGPLVYGGIQYGIVSFGIGCARPRYPGVYTNIRRELNWIRNVIEEWGGQKPKYV